MQFGNERIAECEYAGPHGLRIHAPTTEISVSPELFGGFPQPNGLSLEDYLGLRNRKYPLATVRIPASSLFAP